MCSSDLFDTGFPRLGVGGHSAKFPIRHIAWNLDGGWAVILGQLFRHLCSKLPRRPHAVLALAYGAAFFYRAVGGTALGRITVYVFLFTAATAHLRLCFDETFPTVLFCASVAYAAQNLCYKLYLILWCGGEALRGYDGWGPRFDLYYHVLYYAFFALAAAAVYFLFIRGMLRHMSGGRLDHHMLAIAILVLSITVILCSVAWRQ